MAKLIGMKQICNYVNRSEVTVLDWIRTMDFPALKVVGIYEADTDKIDRWRERRPDRFPQKIDKKKKTETRI